MRGALDHLDNDIKAGRLYLSLLKDWYKSKRSTTEQQVDVLILYYWQTADNRIYSFIFKLHEKLLIKLSRNSFNKYKTYLIDDDYDDIFLLVQGEFIRRVEKYKYPPEAPFPRYIKLYIKQWINVYTKLMVNKNKKTISFTEYGVGRETDKDT